MPTRNPLIATSVDDYIRQLQSILVAGPLDENDLLNQIQTFDAAPEQAQERVKQALKLYANVKLTSSQDAQLIDAALALL